MKASWGQAEERGWNSSSSLQDFTFTKYVFSYIYTLIYTLPPHAEELIGPQVNIFVFSPPPLILLVVRCDLILLESFPGQLLFGRGRV